MNLAIIGPGAMGTQHAAVMSTMERIVPFVVAGPRDDDNRRLADAFGFARTTTDPSLALADPEVDVVVIASPNGVHADQALAAIRAGKHVLIEIPVGLSAAAAQRVADAARTSKATVMAGHVSRYYPALRDLRARIRDGRLHLHQIVAVMGTDKRSDQNQNGEARDWVDDLLWHHGLHVFDTLVWLHGGDVPVSVAAHAGHRHPVHGGVMDLSVSLRFPGDRLATVALTYHANRQFTRYTVVADEAFLDYEQDLSDARKRDLTMHEDFAALVRVQDEAFVSACLTSSPAPVSIDDVLPSMRLVDRIQRALDRSDAEGHRSPEAPRGARA